MSQPDPRQLLAGELLALSDSALLALEAHLSRYALGLPPAEAASPTRTRETDRTRSGLAVLPIAGFIAPRANWLTAWLGGTPLDVFRAQLAAALADDSVRTIVLAVDSGGGFVSGVPETAETLRRARAHKRIVAAVDGDAGSAAYYLASQAHEIAITPSGMAGSIGVVTAHLDQSGLDEKIGVKVTYVHAARYKVEGNPHEPLSKEARAQIQNLVDQAYADFVRDVALGRGVAESTVRSQYGEGRMLTARDAVARGLADRIESFEDVLGSISQAGRASRRAATLRPERLAVELESEEMEMAARMTEPSVEGA